MDKNIISDEEENFVSDEENTIYDEDFIKNTTTTITIFGENALKTAAHYISHGKRNIITREDIKRALILEMFIFNKRDVDIKHFKNVKNELFENNSEQKQEKIHQIIL